MWYDQAQEYLLAATLVASAAAFAIRQRWAAVALLAFGAGAYLGILVTATGALKLPLGPMQAQMHAIWGIPEANLQPPVR